MARTAAPSGKAAPSARRRPSPAKTADGDDTRSELRTGPDETARSDGKSTPSENRISADEAASIQDCPSTPERATGRKHRACQQVRDDEPWLDAEQLEDWISLMAMISTLPSALDAQLKRDAGLNLFEYHILVRLSESPNGAVPMSDLAALALGSPSRLAHAVSRLERAGYVRRIACTEAGRRTATLLTDTGRKKLEESAVGHVREARRLVVDALTAEQLVALGDAARVVAHLASPDYLASLDR
ncbi:MAG TPA: MarR family transcriptional regulator [Microlunatus sp.]